MASVTTLAAGRFLTALFSNVMGLCPFGFISVHMAELQGLWLRVVRVKWSDFSSINPGLDLNDPPMLVVSVYFARTLLLICRYELSHQAVCRMCCLVVFFIHFLMQPLTSLVFIYTDDGLCTNDVSDLVKRKTSFLALPMNHVLL